MSAGASQGSAVLAASGITEPSRRRVAWALSLWALVERPDLGAVPAAFERATAGDGQQISAGRVKIPRPPRRASSDLRSAEAKALFCACNLPARCHRQRAARPAVGRFEFRLPGSERSCLWPCAFGAALQEARLPIAPACCTDAWLHGPLAKRDAA